MAKFVFNLEHVLHHRKHEEQERQRLLADEQAVMTKLEAKLRELDGNVQSNMDDLRNNRLTGSLDVTGPGGSRPPRTRVRTTTSRGRRRPSQSRRAIDPAFAWNLPEDGASGIGRW